MVRPTFGIILFAATLVAGIDETSAVEPNWLPLSKSELLEILSKSSAGQPPKAQSLENLLREHQQASSADATTTSKRGNWLQTEADRLAPDTIWLIDGPQLPYRVVMAGNGGQVHSLRIWVPVVNHSEAEGKRSLEAMTALFTTLYPGWPEAQSWYGDSLIAAWNNHPLARKTPLENPDDVFVRKTAHGITSTTFGVPPDIIVYDVTVRDRCIAVSTQGNPFKRVIC